MVGELCGLYSLIFRNHLCSLYVQVMPDLISVCVVFVVDSFYVLARYLIFILGD